MAVDDSGADEARESADPELGSCLAVTWSDSMFWEFLEGEDKKRKQRAGTHYRRLNIKESWRRQA
jgi:hypothetical protein